MRYFIFTILLVVPLLLTAQSKKEQIATLNLRVDSLFKVLLNERINNEKILSDKTKCILELSQETSDLEKEKVQLSQKMDSTLQRLSEISDSISQKNKELSKLYIYTGEMENDQFNGQGTLRSPSGYKYIGEWKDGKRNGHGRESKKGTTEGMYAGDWVNGEKNGYGTEYGLAGYVGEWKDGKYHGNGTKYYSEMHLSNLIEYVGEMKDGKRHGSHDYTFSDGTKQKVLYDKGKEIE